MRLGKSRHETRYENGRRTVVTSSSSLSGDSLTREINAGAPIFSTASVSAEMRASCEVASASNFCASCSLVSMSGFVRTCAFSPGEDCCTDGPLGAFGKAGIATSTASVQ